jgi:membrane-associated phospholipid phosphatase
LSNLPWARHFLSVYYFIVPRVSVAIFTEDRPISNSFLLFGLTGATWILFLILWPFTAFQLDVMSFWPVALSGLLFLALSWFYSYARTEPSIVAFSNAALVLVLFSCAGELLNYLCLYVHRPLIDAELIDIDRFIGFDWMSYVSFVKADPVISFLLTAAYLSTQMQMICTLALCAWHQKFYEITHFMLAFILAALITIAVSALYPSGGALYYYYMHDALKLPYQFAISYDEVQQLIDLHKGIIPPLSFDHMIGLIGCPSFHTVMSLLIVYALRQIRVIRFIALGLNIIVLLSVPADGGHNFVDLIGGAVVTYLALWLASVLLQSPQRHIHHRLA